MAQFIQAEEAAVGINVVIDSPTTRRRSARRAAGTSTRLIGGRQPGSPDPHVMIYPFFATAGDKNFSGYSNPRLDYVLTNGLEATNPKARARSTASRSRSSTTTGPIIVLYAPTLIAAYSTSLTGVEQTNSAS